MESNIPSILEQCAELFEQRNEKYKDAYKRNGAALKALFPNGLTLTTEDDFGKFVALNWIVAKLNRYAASLDENAGHTDSCLDIVNYAAILAKLTIDAESGKDHEN